MDYTTLVRLIKEFTENDDDSTFVASIPDFVRLAENRIYRSVRLQMMQKTANQSFTSGSPVLNTPSDFISPIHFMVTAAGVKSFLLPKAASFIAAAYPSSVSGVPKYYAMLDHDTILVGPTPDSGYSVETFYVGLPTSIVSAGTTWLGDHGEQALLYGSLVEAYTFMKGDADLIGGYEKKYQEGVLMLKALAEGDNRKDEYKNPEKAMGTN